jgi:hypothetical protein
MKNAFVVAILFVSYCIFDRAKAGATEFRMVVSAGEFDRRDSVVEFKSPQPGTYFRLVDARGVEVALQTEEDRLSFIVNQLAKGGQATYRLTDKPEPAAPPRTISVSADRDGSKLKLRVGDKTVLEYQAEPGDLPRPDIKPIFKRGGYIYPIFSPSGKLVVDDFPPNHVHHHGIWTAWTKTEFEGRHPDFWNMGDGKGRVEFVNLDQHWSGPVHGGFRARHRYVDLMATPAKIAINETWKLKLYAIEGVSKPLRVFDLELHHEAAGAAPLILPKYHYGGLGFRGHRAWDGKPNCFFLTANGETDRVKGNETKGRWCHISGNVDGARTGVAILGHPGDFRAPQPMRLHPSEPFFCYAPSQDGDWEIAPGKPYSARYRFIVQDGEPDSAELDRLWNDYANPVQVKIESP